MVEFTKPAVPVNSFHAAYLALSANDRLRMRNLICIICKIGVATFYDRLKSPKDISPPERYAIALLFNKDVNEIFNSKTDGNN